MVDQTTKDESASFVSTTAHTKFVSRLKTAFLALAGLLVLLLVAWPLINPVEKHLKLSFSSMNEGESGMPQMVNPKFQGVDDRDQPYNISADIAVQETEDTVRLSKVKGDILLKKNNESWVKVTSDGGVITLSERLIKLYGMVHLVSKSGYTVDTETALIDLGKRVASGEDPVRVQGPLGVIDAMGFYLENDTQKLHFVGPVKLVIYPDSNAPKEE